MDLKPYGKFAWLLILTAIALLSGVGSVIREAIAIITNKPPEAWLFWTWVRFVFVVSAFIIYGQEYRRRTKVEKELAGFQQRKAENEELKECLYASILLGESIEDAIIKTQDINIVNNDLVQRWREWQEQVGTNLERFGLHNEAVTFRDAAQNPVDDLNPKYVHIPETKKLFVLLVRTQRKTLQSIFSAHFP